VAELKLAKGWRRVVHARDAGAFVLDEAKGIIWYIDEAPAEAWGPEPKAPRRPCFGKTESQLGYLCIQCPDLKECAAEGSGAAQPEPLYAVGQVVECGAGSVGVVWSREWVPSTARWTYRFAPDGDAFREDELKPHAPVMTPEQERLYLHQRVVVRQIPVGPDGKPLPGSVKETKAAGQTFAVTELRLFKKHHHVVMLERGPYRVTAWAWNVDPEEVNRG